MPFAHTLKRNAKITVHLFLLAIAASLAFAEDFTFRVYRHDSLSFSMDDVDDILDSATSLLQNVCNDLTLSRVGVVRTYGGSQLAMDSSSKFFAFRPIKPPSNAMTIADWGEMNHVQVFVVDSITWCDNKMWPPYRKRGCAPIGESWMVVTRHKNGDVMTRIVWVHEFGHTKTLRHVRNSLSIMSETLGPANTQIDRLDCPKLGDPGVRAARVQGTLVN